MSLKMNKIAALLAVGTLAVGTLAGLCYTSALASVDDTAILLTDSMVGTLSKPSAAGTGNNGQGLSYYIQLLNSDGSSIGKYRDYRSEHVEYPNNEGQTGLQDGGKYTIEVSVGNTYLSGDSDRCDRNSTCDKELYKIGAEAEPKVVDVNYITECPSANPNGGREPLFKAFDQSVNFDFGIKDGLKGQVTSWGYPRIDLENPNAATCKYEEISDGQYQLLDQNGQAITQCGTAIVSENNTVTFTKCTINFAIDQAW